MLRNQLAFGVAVTLLATACSTSYLPRSQGRVAVTMEGGVQTYVRDGRSHSHGFLGSGLVEAVAGVPQAEAAAREYRSRQRDGLLVMLAGTVCAATAVGLATRSLGPERDLGREGVIELSVAGGCTLLVLGGALYTATAEPYRWDAINIFNDAGAPPPFVPYGAPGAARPPVKPKLGLAMRGREL